MTSQYLLDIIIPQYNEKPQVLEKVLSSIALQTGFDFKFIKVTIVNDHNEETFKLIQESGLLAHFPFHIDLIQTPVNGGGGNARQFGFDNTSAPVVTWIDADDILYAADALISVFSAIRQYEVSHTKWSYIWTYFYEEHSDPQSFSLIKHDQFSTVWMHGKFWNRAFLQTNNIRFSTTLRTYEDTYFGKIAALYSPTEMIKMVPVFTYLWRRNPESITSNWNHDGRTYVYWHYQDCIGCQEGTLAATVEQRDKIPLWSAALLGSLYYYFFNETCEGWRDRATNSETEKRLTAIEDSFINLCHLYSDYAITKVSLQQRLSLYQQSYNSLCSKFIMYPPHEGWNNFLQRLADKSPYDPQEVLCWQFPQE